MIREANIQDLREILNLYLHLHETTVPDISAHLEETWHQIIRDPNHHIIVNIAEGRIVSSCVCIIIPNLTHGAHPYALIENVVTDENFRNRGYAGECLQFARKIALQAHCYKIMLLTGAKNENTLDFYRKNGFNSNDKTAFIQWLD